MKYKQPLSSILCMTTINTDTEVDAMVDRVFEYYINPDNIKE
jgi:hypothetical protein